MNSLTTYSTLKGSPDYVPTYKAVTTEKCDECDGTGLLSECCGTTFGNFHECCNRCDNYCETVACEECNGEGTIEE